MAEKKEKKEGGKATGPGVARIVLEGTVEALARLAAEEGLATLFGGTPATPTPPAAGTPGAPAGPTFDVKAAALRALAQEPHAVNAYFQGKADEAQRAIDALNNHMKRRR